MLKPGRETDARVAAIFEPVPASRKGEIKQAADLFVSPGGKWEHRGNANWKAVRCYSTRVADAIAGLEATGQPWGLARTVEGKYNCTVAQAGGTWCTAPTLPLAAAVAICKWGERQ